MKEQLLFYISRDKNGTLTYDINPDLNELEKLGLFSVLEEALDTYMPEEQIKNE